MGEFDTGKQPNYSLRNIARRNLLEYIHPSALVMYQHMIKTLSKSGRIIINISSIAARKATMGMGIYCIAKAAVEMLTQVCAVELAPHRINVNAVAPCMVKTKFSQPFWGDENLAGEISKTIPMGRIPEPDEIVGTVLFLASDLSDFITGEIINVDGGSTAM